MIERYRSWYEQERDSNSKMLDMIESVPPGRRADPRFAQAVTLAAHLAACRENWLDRMVSGGNEQVDWWPQDFPAEHLRDRYTAIETVWTRHLAGLTSTEMQYDFEFTVTDGSRFRWNIEGQIMQLVGHAFYHRGQIALLVEQLGGTTVDTDYLYWALPKNPRYGPID
jgi:uncharacterized damage-inducible protein DinB